MTTQFRQQLRERAKRNAHILTARANGQTYQGIADEFGLSRDRIKQICARGQKLIDRYPQR